MSRVVTNECFVPADAGEVMDIVRDLRSKGLAQGFDFDFEYHRSKFKDDYTLTIERGGSFYFKDPKWATLFRLQYGSK